MKRIIIVLLLISSFTALSQNRQVLRAIEISRMQATPSNEYTINNAARPTPNEVNATTGTSSITTVSWTSVSSNPSPQNGTYSLIMEHTGADNTVCLGLITFPVENGATYEVKVYLNEYNGTNWTWALRDSRGWTVTNNTAVTAVGTWVEFTKTGTTNSTTASIEFIGTASADTGNQLGVDNIIITKL